MAPEVSLNDRFNNRCKSRTEGIMWNALRRVNSAAQHTYHRNMPILLTTTVGQQGMLANSVVHNTHNGSLTAVVGAVFYPLCSGVCATKPLNLIMRHHRATLWTNQATNDV